MKLDKESSVRKLAPVGISTYTRLSHLKLTLDALALNPLSQNTDVFVFSDAARPGDEKLVHELRSYVSGYKAFGSLTLVKRETNNRVFNNRAGVQSLLDAYGKVIFLEDDIETAPGFLAFMNEALEFYRDNEKVRSIGGYCPPVSTEDCVCDAFAMGRFNAWGYGTWSHKFSPFQFDFDEEILSAIESNGEVRKRLQLMGQDVPHMLKLLLRQKIEALDVRVMAFNAIEDKRHLYPRKSLVRNNGHDGSGMHCGVTTKFEPLGGLWDKKSGFVFGEQLENTNVEREHYSFRKTSLAQKVKRFIGR